MATKKGVCKRWSKTGKRRCLKRVKTRRKGRGYRKSRASSRGKRRGYRRGHRPYNKGKRCKAYAVNKRGISTCASYGSKRNKRHKSRLYGPRDAGRSMNWSYEVPTAGVAGLSSYRSKRRRSRRRYR